MPITQEQWKEFEAYRLLPESEEKREKSQLSAAQNDHPHTMGQRSYPRSFVTWEKDGLIPESLLSSSSSAASSSTIVPSQLLLCPTHWILGRKVKLPDGTWVVNAKRPQTQKIVALVEEHLEKEQKEKEEGKYVPQIGVDALTKAGLPNQRGHVKGLGGSVGLKKAYGGVSHRKGSSSHSGYSYEDFEAMRAAVTESVKAEFEVKLEQRVALEVKQVLAAMMGSDLHMYTPPEQEVHNTKMPQTEMPNLHATTSDSEPQQLHNLEGPVSVQLALKDDHGNLVIVAEGFTRPWPNNLIDNIPMKKNHYKIGVDSFISDYAQVELPVPTTEGLTKLGEIEGGFVQWPAELVIFDDKVTPPPTKKIKSKHSIDSNKGSGKGSCNPKSSESATKRKEVNTKELIKYNVEQLGKECRMLHYTISSVPNHNSMVKLPSSIFHHKRNTQINVSDGDILEFLRGDCVNMSLIQVYMMYLFHEYISPLELPHISFLCPERISHVEISKGGSLNVIKYMKDAFLAEGKKKFPRTWILAPIHEKNHWVLIVVDLTTGLAYQFDADVLPQTRELAATECMIVAYRAFWATCDGLKSKSQKLKFIRMKCAQQSGGVESGYYLMKYMDEIVSVYSDCKENLSAVYLSRETPYTKEEIDHVREKWAKFFQDNYLFSDDDRV